MWEKGTHPAPPSHTHTPCYMLRPVRNGLNMGTQKEMVHNTVNGPSDGQLALAHSQSPASPSRADTGRWRADDRWTGQGLESEFWVWDTYLPLSLGFCDLRYNWLSYSSLDSPSTKWGWSTESRWSTPTCYISAGFPQSLSTHPGWHLKHNHTSFVVQIRYMWDGVPAPLKKPYQHDAVIEGAPALCSDHFLKTPCANLRSPTVISKKTLVRNLLAQDSLRLRITSF